jgi:membrane fusion protein (multidrug efflux system)
MSASAKPQIVPAEETNPAEVVAKEKKGNRRLLILGIVAVAVVAIITGYRLLTAGEESTDDATIEGDVVPVAARVGGRVAAVRVVDNARVKKGDVLIEIEDSELVARVKQAEGELAAARAQADVADAQMKVSDAGARGGLSSARAQVSTSRAQASTATAQIGAARAQLIRAEADSRKADLDLDRAQKLRAANVVAQASLDSAQTTSDTAHAALDTARAQLAAAEDGRRAAESKILEANGMLDSNAPVDAKIAAARASADLAHARVTTAEAALDLAKLSLSYAKVVAPHDGTVARLTIREGQLVNPGQPVASVVPDETYVIANFKETQVGAMKAGQHVTVEVDAFGGAKFQGELESLSAGTGSRFSLLPPDNASGNFVKVVQRVPVRIHWTGKNPEADLRAGMSAVVTVHTR